MQEECICPSVNLAAVVVFVDVVVAVVVAVLDSVPWKALTLAPMSV